MPVTFTITDYKDGSGAFINVSGSVAGVSHRIYRARRPAMPGEVANWVLTDTIPGPIASNVNWQLFVEPGDWIWQIRTTADFVSYEFSDIVYAPTTGQLATTPYIYDRRDGSGINVVLQTLGNWVIEVRDTTQDTWRQIGSNFVGSGLFIIPVSDSASGVLLERSYYVRAGIFNSGHGQEILVTPTNQDLFTSDLFPVILAVRESLIQANLPKIGGNVLYCIDPRSSISAVPSQPALWVFQPAPETPALIDQGDGHPAVSISYPVEIGLSNMDDTDVIPSLSWWLHVRWRLFWLFFRKANTLLMGPTKPVRKVIVSFGNVLPDDPTKYTYRYQSIQLQVEIERRIGD